MRLLSLDVREAFERFLCDSEHAIIGEYTANMPARPEPDIPLSCLKYMRRWKR
jgi:hypothetical protein